ncbi:unnamed protein product [Linum tenue]|uniref:Uncharacterized protein n=1 Tax=Linum tenue TaxID=586396 RepID=A0AAV0RBU4_9ROSI|nr:unnamed protein product [Linum tenue]
MADIILGPAVELILGKLGRFASDQVRLLWTLKPEILKLGDTVAAIQAVLLDAEKKQCHNHQVKLWLKRISDVMYDAEDLLDDFSTEAALQKQAVTHWRTGMAATCWSSVCSPVSSLPKQLIYHFKMARDLKAIREKLDVISKEKEAFKLEIGFEVKALPSFRETDACPPTIVIGREDDRKNIIVRLLNCNPEASISVVPIVGMGGLGKTTLAQLVFDDKQVRDYFDIKAWVYVSQSFDIKMILLKMLESITRQKVGDLMLDVLQAQLREKIQGKRYLFVLDDVWEENRRSWENLGNHLAFGALGSKVLVTTRSTRVAEFAGIVESYHLKGLSEEESWNLLLTKALPRKIPQNPYVEEVGREILRKYGGVPLAVNTIAGMLMSSKNPEIDWPSFLHKGLSEEENPTISALKLSFSHLPSHMKHCFAYCKLYQKGYEFHVKSLVQCWVAQGYIESEIKGLDCFIMLWWRSFFQEVEMDELGNMLTCKMHDLMHDLADSVAGNKIIRSLSSTALINIPSKTRHLAIYEDDDNDAGEEADAAVADELENASKVRTLVCHKPLSKQEFEIVICKFIRLRVLIVFEDRSDASTLLHFVGKLKHLRYLVIHCHGMEMLPDPVTNLLNLQVLVLKYSRSLKELPRYIKKLVNLKHLVFDENMDLLTHMPKGIGELKSLQTLPTFMVGKSSSSSNNKTVGAGLDELKGLNALRGELNIKNLVNAEFPSTDVYVLKKKLHLQSLILDWSPQRYVSDDDDNVRSTSTHAEGILEMLWPHPNLKKLMIRGDYYGLLELPNWLPNWLSSLVNLVEFSLIDCLQSEHLPPLHQLWCLKKLKIDNCPELKGINNDADRGDHCDPSPNSSTTEEKDDEWPHFHCLAYLSLQNCPKLTLMPTFPSIEGELRLVSTSLKPLVRTMKMRRGGRQVVHSDEYTNSAFEEYDDADTALLPRPSSHLALPLSKLTDLTLNGIDDDLELLPGADFSSSCLISLQQLCVWSCSHGLKLPSSLCSSTSLTIITIGWCDRLEYLPPLHELVSLRELFIEGCPSLKGCWWKKKGNHDHSDPLMEEEDGEEADEEEWPHFRCLSSLKIKDCPNLTQMPLFPNLEVELKLWRTSTEALVRTMKMKVATTNHHDSQKHTSSAATMTNSYYSSSSSSSCTALLTPPLSNLTKLSIRGIDELHYIPEDGLRHLTSLQDFVIKNCSSLASLPPAMHCLTSLQTLYIRRCPQLAERCRKEEGEDWPNISHIPNILLDGEALQDYSGLGSLKMQYLCNKFS